MCRAHVVYYSAEKGIDYRTHHKKILLLYSPLQRGAQQSLPEMSDLTQHLVNLK